MAQSLFVLMILSTLQICCRKKKAKTKTKTKAANVVVETSNDTTGNIAQTAPEINLQKTVSDNKYFSKNEVQ